MTTRGSADWLQEKIDEEPFVKKKILIDEFDVTEEGLRKIKEFRKLHY